MTGPSVRWWALTAALLLIAAAVLVPPLTGWDVHARSAAGASAPPWHGYWQPKVGPGTPAALILAVLAVGWGPHVARTLPFARLLAASAVASLAWMLSLATVTGLDGLSRVLGNRWEYLPTARQVTDVGDFLSGFIDRIPMDAEGHWPVHVAGHPPGITVFFVLLARAGLGGDLAAGVVVTVLAATIAPAVLLTLRLLGEQDTARRVAPFVVFAPAALFLAVSADAVMAATAAWAMAALAMAATRSLWWAPVAGLLFGALVMMSYGLLLFALVALGLMAGRRAWRPLLPTAAAAALVVLLFAWGGFAWWEAYGPLRDRYWAGIAAERPASYWLWGNLAALLATTGPAVAPGIASLRRLPRVPAMLVIGAVAAILIADLSLMSKSEVHRIWLPFMPWLIIATAALPDRWARPSLAMSVATAVAIEHLLYTSW